MSDVPFDLDAAERELSYDKLCERFCHATHPMSLDDQELYRRYRAAYSALKCAIYIEDSLRQSVCKRITEGRP